MKLPSESMSSWTHIQFAAFTWASLNAWSDFSDLPDAERKELARLAQTLRVAIESLLVQARQTQDRMIFGWPQAHARRNAWLTLLHRRISEALAMLVHRAAGGARNHPLVREFLPNLIGGIVKQAIDDRPRLTTEAADRLERLRIDFVDKLPQVGRLREAASGTDQAIREAAGAQALFTRDRSEEVVAKAHLRLELERVHRNLGAQFAGQREFVESFFLRGAKPGPDKNAKTAASTPAVQPKEDPEKKADAQS